MLPVPRPRRPLLLSSVVLAASIAVSACSIVRDASAPRAAEADDWARQAWVAKAARTLFYGSPDLPLAELEELAALPREQAVDRMMADPRFLDTVIDFNMYFYGIKEPSLRESRFSSEQKYRDAIFGRPAVAIAARELLAGGDYFTLFDWRLPYQLIRQGYIGYPADQPNLTPMERQAHFLDQAAAVNTDLRAKLPSMTDVEQICDAVFINSEFSDKIAEAGFGLELMTAVGPAVHEQLACFGESKATLTVEQARAVARAALDRQDAQLAKLRELAAGPSSASDLGAMGILTARDGAVFNPGLYENIGVIAWSKLANSSTNFNRKRAAYMLKTYFCDDLTPLNITTPASHTSNRHASDPACQACHYKLDPMAGFFRDRGANGLDMAGTGTMLHDDGVMRSGADLDAYLASWKAPEGSPRVWNVGYIRSTRKDRLNSYGESLDDLARIIREAPESKVCLAKRMTEYVLGVDQIYDGKWVQGLADTFQRAAAPGAPAGASSAAFKSVMKTLVLSNTFTTPDPERGSCYDFAPGAAPSTLPCAVAFIFEKNCATCHQGEGAPRGLDLTTWVPMAGGSSGFRHLDGVTGKQVPPQETLARIACALSPSPSCPSADDPAHYVPLMPLGRDMSAVDRATLYRWVLQAQGGAR